ncbi:GYF domain-containing protein [Bythopirellula goksoeyrii]|uniref:Double zinc ribbon n=1 Tax=Bythopirellula goksoeyrii TaxID=1400387 RepID=A0A5B9Q825_9BACT|nr:Double zinc ribbon [Bythopirellula goksoeyrii]
MGTFGNNSPRSPDCCEARKLFIPSQSRHNAMPANSAIEVDCPNCGATFNMPSRLLGKNTKCTKCGKAFTIEKNLSLEQSSDQTLASDGIPSVSDCLTSDWYFQSMGETIGPISFSEFSERNLSGQVAPSTLVWTNKFPNWLAADAIPGLLEIAKQSGANDSPGDLGHRDKETGHTRASHPSTSRKESLTQCPDCGATISRRATTCPNCGAPLSSAEFKQEYVPNNPKITGTDPFAVLTLISGILSLLILPILFAPMALVCGTVSTNSLMRNPSLGGGGMRTGGMILAGLSLLIMFVRLASI